MKFRLTLAVAMLSLACSGKGGGGTGGGSGGSGGTAGGSSGMAGGRAGGATAGGATAGGATAGGATAGGAGTAGGATAGGAGTAGGATAGGATAGGTGTAGGAAAGGTGTGGGSGMLCGGLPCVNGCCGGNFCLGYGGQTANSCGDMGAACAACPMGQTCTMGRCVPPTPPQKQIGDPCLMDNECAILGANYRCKTMTSSGNASYPGGYCTKICTMDTECTSPAGDGGLVNNGWCIGLNPAYGEGDRFCWRKCSGTFGPCRAPDYACYNLGTTPTGQAVNACWLAQIPTVDAGPPSNKLGNPCMNNAQCSNPPDPAYGVCLLEFFINADGGSTNRPTGYTGGYCSANCNITQAVCGADGICLSNFISSAGNGIDGCARRCPSAWTGQGPCRPEYVCEGFVFLLADGGTTPAPPDAGGFCSPSCFADGGECGGQDAGFYCDAGYCTR